MSEIEKMIEHLDDAIEIVKCYGEMMEKGNCNTCKVFRSCQYAPKLGEIVRVNCPLYVKPEGGIGKVVTPQKDKGEGASHEAAVEETKAKN